ncbi:hypothetical protein PP175_06260 [Aneurinibacillus sp. Ricciae_BoGa-3]|uniref:hypothetical protein n=1 Tax=Aneurinibacillus sp. Ricciae_BoGa-3 TaxID=3022697 RepID=UPI002341632E|nr:hypothetical protein [Aneurinibacillus sp. Ricciae_BoGa-3]WCK55544.1 hypothetical protein PP175_06260 [Aneurinibacillus sp. Ricciae_BoGa-3]
MGDLLGFQTLSGNQLAKLQYLSSIEGKVYSAAFYLTGNQQDAVFVSQEVLLAIYKNTNGSIHTVDSDSLIQRLVTNACLSLLAKRNTKNIS